MLLGARDAASRRMARARPSAVAARTQASEALEGRKELELLTTGGEIDSVTRFRVGTTTGEPDAEDGEEDCDGGSGTQSMTSRHHGVVARSEGTGMVAGG